MCNLCIPLPLPNTHTAWLPILNEEEASHQIVKDSSSTSISGLDGICTLESGLMWDQIISQIYAPESVVLTIIPYFLHNKQKNK